MDALPSYLKGFATFAYKTGWRVSEISNLTWNQVDRDQGIVRLETGETKNDEGRTVYLDEELKEVFNKQWEIRKKGHRMGAIRLSGLIRHGKGPAKMPKSESDYSMTLDGQRLEIW